MIDEPTRSRGWRRRALLTLAATAALPCTTARAQAWDIGAKPIRIVVPAPAGGPADTLARSLARRLGVQTSATVYVENKPGGASIPAALDVLRAAPDGHTLFLGLNTTHTQVPHLQRKAPFDPLRDFTPISQLYESSSVLVAHPSVAANTLTELVAQAKVEPFSFASASVGTSGHLYIEMLNAQHRTRFDHVPYKGSADAGRDLLGGIVKLLFDSPTSAVPLVRSGRLKALAVTGSSRLAALPAVGTAREQGFPELEIVNWIGVFGPANLPPPVLARLNAEFVAAVRSDEVRAQLEPLGVRITGTGAGDFSAIVRRDHESWGRIIRDIGLQTD